MSNLRRRSFLGLFSGLVAAAAGARAVFADPAAEASARFWKMAIENEKTLAKIAFTPPPGVSIDYLINGNPGSVYDMFCTDPDCKRCAHPLPPYLTSTDTWEIAPGANRYVARWRWAEPSDEWRATWGSTDDRND